MRMVLIAYPPGFVSVPHRHPHALESFLVLEGTGNFIIGNRPYGGTPGTLLWSPPGVQHTIAVTGTSDLVFLASIGPNENRPDETIETPIEESVDPAGH
jgi:quercetin dioxygenase-like cupin family protein